MSKRDSIKFVTCNLEWFMKVSRMFHKLSKIMVVRMLKIKFSNLVHHGVLAWSIQNTL